VNTPYQKLLIFKGEEETMRDVSRVREKTTTFQVIPTNETFFLVGQAL